MVQMLSEHEVSGLEIETNDLDEEWWAAVLADEECLCKKPLDEFENKGAASSSTTLNWDRIKDLHEHDGIVMLDVYGYNRGGLLVQGDELQGFVPVSHLVDLPPNVVDEERNLLLSNYVGRALCLKVIECNPAMERVVFSERAAQAGEGCRRELFLTLKPGKIIGGKVTNVTDFGIFIDLGGVEGLVHVSELSWGRVSHPSEILKVGQAVQTMVLQVSEENSRVALSLKRLFPNPWDDIAQRYCPGDVIPAVITSIVRFGAFARLEEGIEGLIHISSLQLPEGKQELDSFFHVGQGVQVKVLHIDTERRRLGLDLVNFE
jgi:small subunit ribosomal protein S1